MEDSSGDTYGSPDSVELLLAFLRDVVLADESERQRNLDAKAGTLAGFVAVALSLEAGLGASVLFRDGINCSVRTLFIAFFVVAIVGLASAGLFALLGVLIPKDYEVLHDDQIDEWATAVEMARPADVIRERQLATLSVVIRQARTTNGKKAKALKGVAISLGIAVSAIAAQGLTLPFG